MLRCPSCISFVPLLSNRLSLGSLQIGNGLRGGWDFTAPRCLVLTRGHDRGGAQREHLPGIQPAVTQLSKKRTEK